MDVRLGALALTALAVGLVSPANALASDVSSREAERIADRDPKVAALADEREALESSVTREDDGAWTVSYFDGDDEVAQAIVEPTGGVRESWTGEQVAWRMARGYEGQFGHVLNAPYVWLPLCALFLLCLLDYRRPLRVVHLDLLVLLAFGISHVFFNRAEIGVSVPLAYPCLAYLLARALWLGVRGGEGLRPSVPWRLLALAAIFLVAFRVTINVADSGVIDVGYSGVIGADRVVDGEPIYGKGRFPAENGSGDTYGPANYLAYVPFELALPWSGEWDELPAGHAAAIGFDLATVVGLAALGLSLRRGRAGRELAAVLAFAWLAYPYTTYALQSNSNDALVAALVVWSLVAFRSPLARGALLALAAATKFAPLVLVPLYAAGERGLLDRARSREAGGRGWLRRLRPSTAFALAFASVAALVLAHPAIDPGLATFWERTVASQADRDSPFSIWGQASGLEWLRGATIVGVGALAAALAFVPRHRDLVAIAALAAAALIAVQLTAQHWFYLYIPWFFAPLLVAMAATSRQASSTKSKRPRWPFPRSRTSISSRSSKIASDSFAGSPGK